MRNQNTYTAFALHARGEVGFMLLVGLKVSPVGLVVLLLTQQPTMMLIEHGARSCP